MTDVRELRVASGSRVGVRPLGGLEGVVVPTTDSSWIRPVLALRQLTRPRYRGAVVWGVREVGWEANTHVDDLRRHRWGWITKPGFSGVTMNLKAGSRLNQRYVRIGAVFVLLMPRRNRILMNKHFGLRKRPG